LNTNCHTGFITFIARHRASIVSSSGFVLNPVVQALSTCEGPLVFTSLNAVIEWMGGKWRRPFRWTAEETYDDSHKGNREFTFISWNEGHLRKPGSAEGDSVTIARSTAAIIFKHAMQIEILSSTGSSVSLFCSLCEIRSFIKRGFRTINRYYSFAFQY